MDITKSVITTNYLGPEFNDMFFSGVVARIEINQTAHSSQNGNNTSLSGYSQVASQSHQYKYSSMILQKIVSSMT